MDPRDGTREGTAGSETANLRPGWKWAGMSSNLLEWNGDDVHTGSVTVDGSGEGQVLQFAMRYQTSAAANSWRSHTEFGLLMAI